MKKAKKRSKEKKALLLHALKQRALVYSLTGHHEKGVEDLRTASQFCKKDSDIDIATSAMCKINLADFIARCKGEYLDAEKLIKKAFAEIDTRKHLQVYARGLLYLGIISFLQADYDKALFYNKKALEIYKKKLPKQKKSIMETYVSLGLLYHYKRDVKTSLLYYRKGLALAKATDDKFAISTISNNIGTVYRDQGDSERAQSYFSTHLAMSKSLGYKKGIGIAMGNIANITLDKDLFNEAKELLKEARRIFEEIDDTIGIILSLGNLALANYRLGELTESMQLYEKCMRLSKKVGFTIGVGIGHIGLAKISIDMDDISSAEMHLKKAKGMVEKVGDKLTLSEIYHYLSTLNLKMGDLMESQRYAEEALTLARQSGSKAEEIIALRALGLAYSESDIQKANTSLKKSILLAEKNQRKLEKAKSQYAFADFLISRGMKREAGSILLKAINIFREIDSKAWLNKANQLKKQLG